ncbi:hypothetical protein [Saccharothrix luteola]|uniref:hypothetical protein n=1 Tax=Saccharothrix luteola TaxID=2893018 RepID=UPI001E3ABCBE|nr:hypothetical protein [Saccharothrix luteola]MCC8248038.1 hypothetical protein [Saccharothrix luteola]
MSVDQAVERTRRRSNGVAGGLALVVRGGLPLERLSDAGYTPLMFEAVMRHLVGDPHGEWSLRSLARLVRMPYTAVRHICRDLVELGHVIVRVGPQAGAGRPAHLHRLSPEGLAYWGGPVVAHDWLRDADAWRDLRLTPVMGSRLSAEDRTRGEVVGYSFPVLYRVADALVLVPSREWSVTDLVTAAGADAEMVRLACLDLVAAGHAMAHEWREDGGEGREETRFKISLAGLVGPTPGCWTRGYAAWVSVAGVGVRLFS